MKNDLKKIVKSLKRKEICHSDIPEEYINNIEIIEAEKKIGIRKIKNKGFDIIKNNFFVNEEIISLANNSCLEISETRFNSFDEFYKYIEGDIYSNCCFYQYTFNSQILKKYKIKTNDINFNSLIDYTIEDGKIDGKSKDKLLRKVHKYYENDVFKVSILWYDNNNFYYSDKLEFEYFFDFVHYLNNDLSDSDLLLCDGIINLKDISKLNLTNVHFKSPIMDKFNIKYIKYENSDNIVSFKKTIKNENETKIILHERNEILDHTYLFDHENYRISYITDLHLDYKLKECKSETDIEYIIKKIVKTLVKESTYTILIGGDVSFNFNVYRIFVTELRKELDLKKSSATVIFTLGNHELWPFENKGIDEIYTIYNKLITQNRMHLLHNNLLYISSSEIEEISCADLLSLNVTEIRKKLRKCSVSFFGGIGFSGYNLEFNANTGIYKNTINRKKEELETKQFERIYNKCRDVLFDKNVIVLTHMPKKDWSCDKEYEKDWVYISGHTHRNYFYDDGSKRIYSDNQQGYFYNDIVIKNFKINCNYDFFSDYKEGIYEITGDNYTDFLRGKNIQGTYHRNGILFMLKKNNYYCFIKPSKTGLCILNGGALKKLPNRNIDYFYNNMNAQIEINKKPLDQYIKYQEKISNEIKKIGGYGIIHGCIVDIDFFNHIYINPFDGTLTAYNATDIINKYVYKNIPSLLIECRPDLYQKYIEAKTSANKAEVIIYKSNYEIDKSPEYYSNTDIYRASNEIRKLQKLSNGVLCTWHDKNENFLIDTKEVMLKKRDD